MLICPRTGGCTILSFARCILDRIARGWVDVRDLIGELSGDGVEDVVYDAEDVLGVVKELVAQDFIVVDGTSDEVGLCERGDEEANRPAEEEGDDSMPLSGFYRRHNHLPVEFHMDVTDACTEHCVHCYVPQKNHFLPIAMVKKALLEFRDLQGLTLHLTGGEAMMHPDFREICLFCKSIGLNLIVFSNLTLCDQDMVAFLAEVDPQFVNVSLYAMNPRIHDLITQRPGSWLKTINAIAACQKAGVHVRIATPLLNENKDEFGELVRFAESHHVHLIPNFDIVPRSDHDCANLSHCCSPAELEVVLRKHKDLFDEGYGNSVRNELGAVCSIGKSRVYLNAKGNYYPCDSMHEYALGSVATDSVRQIWYGEKLNALRSLKNSDFVRCMQCEHKSFCKICPAFNYNAMGDVRAVVPAKCEVSSVVHRVYGGSEC